MKEILFSIMVGLLTPLYICLIIGKKAIEFSVALFSPMIEAIQILVNNMTEFWKKIFKFKEEM